MTKQELKQWIQDNCFCPNGKLKTSFTRKISSLPSFTEILNTITQFTPFIKSNRLSERLYCILKDISEIPIINDREASYGGFKRGYVKSRPWRIGVSSRIKKPSKGYAPSSLEDLKKILLKSCFNARGNIQTQRILNEPLLLEYIHKHTQFLNTKPKVHLTERIYCIFNDIKEVQYCSICKQKPVRFKSFKEGYSYLCGLDCQKKERLQKAIDATKGKPSKNRGKKHSPESVAKGNKNRGWYYKSRKGKPSFNRGKILINNTLKERFVKGFELDLYFEQGFQIGRLPVSEDTLDAMRIGRHRYLQDVNCQGPSFNKISINWFIWVNTIFDLKGQFGEHPKEKNMLGYWLDFYDPENKIIIEWDEERHYKHNQLQEYDVYRQNRILTKLPDFRFIRIRQKDFMGLSLEEKFNYINIRLNNS